MVYDPEKNQRAAQSQHAAHQGQQDILHKELADQLHGGRAEGFAHSDFRDPLKNAADVEIDKSDGRRGDEQEYTCKEYRQ